LARLASRAVSAYGPRPQGLGELLKLSSRYFAQGKVRGHFQMNQIRLTNYYSRDIFAYLEVIYFLPTRNEVAR
jgi:hypothetical protein